jgi:hypothetical protein
MTYVTKYETRDGKTYRVEDAPPETQGAADPAAAPKSDGADHSQAPARPAKGA